VLRFATRKTPSRAIWPHFSGNRVNQAGGPPLTHCNQPGRPTLCVFFFAKGGSCCSPRLPRIAFNPPRNSQSPVGAQHRCASCPQNQKVPSKHPTPSGLFRPIRPTHHSPRPKQKLSSRAPRDLLFLLCTPCVSALTSLPLLSLSTSRFFSPRNRSESKTPLNSQKHGGCPGFRCSVPGSWGRLFHRIGIVIPTGETADGPSLRLSDSPVPKSIGIQNSTQLTKTRRVSRVPLLVPGSWGRLCLTGAHFSGKHLIRMWPILMGTISVQTRINAEAAIPSS
jgi:hypothetical protein